VKTIVLKYLTVICLLLGMLESNHIPVVSVFSKQVQAADQRDIGSAEDPVKESETLRIESVKDYLHEFITFNFNQPVFLVPIKRTALYKSKFPYCFYPDVLTPPPNC
jgi:aromatic ring-opening dioxygenase catalytic subunit (LigB family)